MHLWFAWTLKSLYLKLQQVCVYTSTDCLTSLHEWKHIFLKRPGGHRALDYCLEVEKNGNSIVLLSLCSTWTCSSYRKWPLKVLAIRKCRKAMLIFKAGCIRAWNSYDVTQERDCSHHNTHGHDSGIMNDLCKFLKPNLIILIDLLKGSIVSYNFYKIPLLLW